MNYKTITTYILAAGMTLGVAAISRTAMAEESSSFEKVVCTYDSVQGSLCFCQPVEKKVAPKPKLLTCEQKCGKEYKRIHERNCGEALRALQEYDKELERRGSRWGISRPSDNYSGCITEITQKRRFCLDACEEGHPEEAERMIKYGQCKDGCYNAITPNKSYIDQILEEKKRLGVKRRLNSEQLNEFERGYHQKEREYNQKIKHCLQKCGEDPYLKRQKMRKD